jgi:hypothetical protein
MFGERIMDQRILAALTVTAIVLGVINLTLLLILNPQINTTLSESTLSNTAQEIPLEVQYIGIRNSSEYYVVQITASIPDEPLTLFNCVMQVDYLTESNTWKTTSDYLGIVDFHSTVIDHNVVIDRKVIIDSDFRYEPLPLRITNFTETYTGSNIKVEAYGYPKP